MKSMECKDFKPISSNGSVWIDGRSFLIGHDGTNLYVVNDVGEISNRGPIASEIKESLSVEEITRTLEAMRPHVSAAKLRLGEAQAAADLKRVRRLARDLAWLATDQAGEALDQLEESIERRWPKNPN